MLERSQYIYIIIYICITVYKYIYDYIYMIIYIYIFNRIYMDLWIFMGYRINMSILCIEIDLNRFRERSARWPDLFQFAEAMICSFSFFHDANW